MARFQRPGSGRARLVLALLMAGCAMAAHGASESGSAQAMAANGPALAGPEASASAAQAAAAPTTEQQAASPSIGALLLASVAVMALVASRRIGR